jgi:hypothetical protein
MRAISPARASIAAAISGSRGNGFLAVAGAVLGAGQQQQVLHQPVGLVEPFAELAPQHGQLRGDRPGFGGGHIQRGAHHRQRGAQLVRGAGGEPALRGEGGLQPCQQLIDGVAEVFELITGTGDGRRRRSTRTFAADEALSARLASKPIVGPAAGPLACVLPPPGEDGMIR